MIALKAHLTFPEPPYPIFHGKTFPPLVAFLLSHCRNSGRLQLVEGKPLPVSVSSCNDSRGMAMEPISCKPLEENGQLLFLSSTVFSSVISVPVTSSERFLTPKQYLWLQIVIQSPIHISKSCLPIYFVLVVPLSPSPTRSFQKLCLLSCSKRSFLLVFSQQNLFLHRSRFWRLSFVVAKIISEFLLDPSYTSRLIVTHLPSNIVFGNSCPGLFAHNSEELHKKC